MKLLRQSTEQVVQFGPAVSFDDGVTLEIGLATAMDNATTGIRISKDGAAYADRNSATAPSYDAMGDYRITLSTTDTNTVGILKMIFEEATTCLPIWQEFFVVPANVYDALTGADLLDVNVAQWLGTACETPATAGVPAVDAQYINGNGVTGDGNTTPWDGA